MCDDDKRVSIFFQCSRCIILGLKLCLIGTGNLCLAQEILPEDSGKHRDVDQYSKFLHDHHQTPEGCPEWVTIFVHGTIMPHLSLNNLIKILKDKMDRSAYALTTEFIRNDSFFYQNQAISQLGLHRIDDENSAAFVFAKIYDELGSLNQPKLEKNWYYTYGWSGLLSSRSRRNEAHTFYNALANMLQQFRRQGHVPKVRMVTYSHGGNLVANLASIEREFSPTYPITVDELICVGLPIQQTTNELVHAAMFKRIFNVYSLSDNVQRIDFASRRFNEAAPEKLTQVKVRLYGVLDKKKQRYLPQRIDPGHIEFWFFGWSTKYYRKKFPCFPLPFSVMLQWIVNQVKKYGPAQDSVELFLNLPTDIVQIKCYRSRNKGKVEIPFIPRQLFEKMKAYARKVKPDRARYSQQLHDKRRKWARLQAAQVKRLLNKKVKKKYPQHDRREPSEYRRRPIKLGNTHYVTQVKPFMSDQE